MRRMLQNPLYIHQLCDSHHFPVHFFCRNAVIFQSESNILRNRQTDELTIRILQDRTHDLGKAKQAQLQSILTANGQLTGSLAGIGIGHQAVNAMGQGGFSAAGRAGDQDLFALADLQIDIIEGRLRLGSILEAKILKGNNCFVFQWIFLLRRKAGAGPAFQNV